MAVITSHLATTISTAALIALPALGATIHVDANVSGGNQTGTSWANAMRSLQTALDQAVSGDVIWVADGTYTVPSVAGYEIADNDVRLYGGFDGGTTNETELNQRNFHKQVAILTGDINGDDDPDDLYNPALTDDNANHVVNVASGIEDAWIDGFTITGGIADGTGTGERNGGGMRVVTSHPIIIANIIFKHNYANGNGGGLYYGSGNVFSALVNCSFIGNETDGSGGGAYIEGPIEQVTNCSFAANIAFFEGGGLGNDSGYPIIVSQCSFSKNDAGAANTRRGSGLYCAPGPDAAVTTDDSTADIRNCIFWENGLGVSEAWVIASVSNVEPACGQVSEAGPIGWFYDLDQEQPYYIVQEILPPGESCQEVYDEAIQGLLARGPAVPIVIVDACTFTTLEYGAHFATTCDEVWFDQFHVSVDTPGPTGNTYGLRGGITKLRWRDGSLTNDGNNRAIVRFWGTIDGMIIGEDEPYSFTGGQVRLGGSAGTPSDPVQPLSNVLFRNCTITAENADETVLELYQKTHHVTFQEVDFESNGGDLATCHTSYNLQRQPIEPWAHDITFIDCTLNGSPITNLAGLVNADGTLEAQKITVQSAPNEQEAKQFYAPNNYEGSSVKFSDIEGLIPYGTPGYTFDTEDSGNISVNPQFADPLSNLRLADCSPCIDAGDNALVPGGSGGTEVTGDAADLDYGNDFNEVLPNDGSLAPRIVDNPNVTPNGAAIVDMGAYEIPGCATPADLFPTCRPNCGFGDGFVGAGDLAELLANWGLNPANVCADIFSIGAPDNNVGAGDLGELLANWGNVPEDCGGEGFGGGAPGNDDSTDDSGYYSALDADPAFCEWALSATIDELMTWLETGDWGG